MLSRKTAEIPLGFLLDRLPRTLAVAVILTLGSQVPAFAQGSNCNFSEGPFKITAVGETSIQPFTATMAITSTQMGPQLLLDKRPIGTVGQFTPVDSERGRYRETADHLLAKTQACEEGGSEPGKIEDIAVPVLICLAAAIPFVFGALVKINNGYQARAKAEDEERWHAKPKPPSEPLETTFRKMVLGQLYTLPMGPAHRKLRWFLEAHADPENRKLFEKVLAERGKTLYDKLTREDLDALADAHCANHPVARAARMGWEIDALNKRVKAIEGYRHPPTLAP